MAEPIRDFTDLIAWKEGHKLVLETYSLTKKFPKEEAFGLVSQMRRAAVSITSNIAEGYGRQGYKEKVQFFYLAQGSIIELKNQLLISRDIGYVSVDEWGSIMEQADTAHKLLQGLISKSRTFISKP